jgi:hypothetical protein
MAAILCREVPAFGWSAQDIASLHLICGSTVKADLINGARPGDTTFNALGGTSIQGQSNIAVSGTAVRAHRRTVSAAAVRIVRRCELRQAQRRPYRESRCAYAGWVLSSVLQRKVTLKKANRSEVLVLQRQEVPAGIAGIPALPLPGPAISGVGVTYAPFTPRSTPKSGESDGL